MSLDFSPTGSRLLGPLTVPAATQFGADPSATETPLPDAALIARVLDHDDRDAFGELVRRHQSAVRGFLRHLSRGNTLFADDLAQETFVHAYRALGQYRGGAAFSTWLLGIAHNHFRNARRRDLTAANALVSLEPPSDTDPHGRADLVQDVAHAMQHVSEDERAVLHLHYHQALTHAEIATVLNWPLGTIKTHLARAKEKLKPHLAAWNPNA